MTRSSKAAFGWMALIATTLALAACDKRPEGNRGGDSSAASTSPTVQASGPLPGIVPQAGDAAGSAVPGPGSGATAVGGLAGAQESGGARKNSGDSPAPTGGDSAASAPR